MPTSSDFIEAAWKASPEFGLDPSDITIISHTENVVCQLTMPGDDSLVMRLHRPGYNSLGAMESEVQWVTSLERAGIPVPRPVPLIDSEGPARHYCTVQVGDADEPCHVGVVRWVPGQPLGGTFDIGDGDGDVVSHYERIGELTARIRQHHATWTPPPGFTRRRWDSDGLVGERPLWGRFWEVEALNDRQRSVFAEARNAIRDELSTLASGDDLFGLIHADLHTSNVMVSGDDLTIIDFDDAGYGWFAYELAVALHPVVDKPSYPDARRALLAGHRSVHELSVEEERSIETFLTVRHLMIVGWLDARPELTVHQYLPDLAARATRAADDYLSGRLGGN